VTVIAQYTLLPDVAAPPSSGNQALFVVPGTRLTPLGSDLAGVTSLDYALTTATGRLALAQAILRRLTTPLGGLVGTPTYGYDVLALIGSTVPEQVIEESVLEQVLFEEEVEDASCAAARIDSSLNLQINVIDSDGPFELTLTAEELTAAAFVDGVPIFQQAA
jgi:hypothetical protein